MKKMITTLPPPPAIRQGDLFGKDIRVVWENNEPLFVMRDVCEVLEIRWHRNAMRRLRKGETCGVTVHTSLGPREMAAVTEPGLYHLIFISRKPVAEAFQEWVAHEVLPALRRQGYYVMPGRDVQVIENDVGEVQAPAAFVCETAAIYLEKRGLKLSASGLSLRCRRLCEAEGIEPRQCWSGTRYPIHILDMAVKGRDRDALRGPAIPEKPDIISFYTDLIGARS